MRQAGSEVDTRGTRGFYPGQIILQTGVADNVREALSVCLTLQER